MRELDFTYWTEIAARELLWCKCIEKVMRTQGLIP